jgi:hypothetical protein
MATGTVMPVPQIQFLDNDGNPLSGGKLYTYVAGTTTNLATYSDSALSSANANPVVLDAGGRATVYLQPKAYKFKLDNSSDVTVYTQDNILALQGEEGASLEITGTAGEALSANNFVYLSDGSGSLTAGRWYKTDADLDYANTDAVLGVVAAAIDSGAEGRIRIGGKLAGFSGMTTGKPQYLSATAGARTETAPNQERVVGRATSSAEILLDFSPSRVGLVQPQVCGGRLTLEDGAPIATSDQTGATTIYFTPYMGNKISLYNTSTAHWTIHQFAQLSHSLSGETADKNYDVFAKSTNGVVSLESLVWTDDTNRATNLVMQDGVYCKTGALDQRYIGTYRTTSSTGQCEDSQSKRFVWNAYNQIDRQLYYLPSANSWTYTTATIRQANNTAANKVEAVSGLEGSSIHVDNWVMCSNGAASASTFMAVGIGESSTTANATGTIVMPATSLVADAIVYSSAHLKKHKAAGYHYYAMLEWSTAANTTTWYGDNGAPTVRQSGISAIYRN